MGCRLLFQSRTSGWAPQSSFQSWQHEDEGDIAHIYKTLISMWSKQWIHDPLLGCCFHILLASPGPAIPGVGIVQIVLFQRFSRLSSFKDFQHHLLSKIVEIVKIVLFQRLQFAAEVFVALAADFQFNPSKFCSVAFSTFFPLRCLFNLFNSDFFRPPTRFKHP